MNFSAWPRPIRQIEVPVAIDSSSVCDLSLQSQRAKTPDGYPKHEPPCIWMRRTGSAFGAVPDR